MGYANAEAALGEAGLTVGNVREIPSNSEAAGVVIEQGYQPGAEVAPGTNVNLGVSSGPQPVAPQEPPSQDAPPPDQPEQQPQEQPQPQQDPPQQPEEQPQPQPEEPQQQPGDNIQDRVDEQPGDVPESGGNGGNGSGDNGDGGNRGGGNEGN